MFRAVTRGAEKALNVALKRVPVDNGDLKSTLEVDDNKRGRAVFSAGGQSKISSKMVDYTAAVEFGSTQTTAGGTVISQPAQPFFRAGLIFGRTKLIKEMKLRSR